MAKRDVVKLNIESVLPLIKRACRSNVVFCEKMGRHATWVSDWARKSPKNLPSPEEAAQMCAILQVMPEDILVTAEDIEKVRALLDSQRQKETPTGSGEDNSKLLDLFDQLDELDQKMIYELMKAKVEARSKNQ